VTKHFTASVTSRYGHCPLIGALFAERVVAVRTFFEVSTFRARKLAAFFTANNLVTTITR